MEIDFRVDIRQEGDVRLVKVAGEISLYAASSLDEKLDEVLRPGVRLVILDLEQVEFIDSTGLSVLVRAQQRAVDSGIEFGIVRAVAQVERLLRLTGLAERLELPDAEERLSAILPGE